MQNLEPDGGCRHAEVRSGCYLIRMGQGACKLMFESCTNAPIRVKPSRMQAEVSPLAKVTKEGGAGKPTVGGLFLKVAPG